LTSVISRISQSFHSISQSGHHSLIIFIPLSIINSLLHLFQSIRKHSLECLGHGLSSRVQLSNLNILITKFFFLLLFKLCKFLFFFLNDHYLFLYFFFKSLSFFLKLLLHSFILWSHAWINSVHSFFFFFKVFLKHCKFLS